MGLRAFQLHDLGPTFDVGAHVQPPATVEALTRWFGFSLEELALNRVGRLSARQRQNVRFQGLCIIVVGGVLVLLDMLLTVTVAPTAKTMAENLALDALVLLNAVIVVIIGLAAVEILLPRVHTFTGPLCLAGTPRSPRLRAGDRLLVIPYRRWQRWQRLNAPDRQLYRTYYVGRTLLSIEPWNGS
ncbi:hypothetical protein [Aggregatilinea lenta]|uniref:hypothetical protein n=1 Tax=Aggregatilinea lenta TaxID=913108 RepID=UPI0013C3289C|nr:hypothetical protein [Aggregatilinea lenta]